MTPEMWGIFLQIVILLAFGYFFTKKKILTSDIKNGLSTLLLKLVLPISILGSSQIAYRCLYSQRFRYHSGHIVRLFCFLCPCLFCVWWQGASL